MEIVYYNNADYEQFLLSNNDSYSFQLNKTNKEFEYFILIIEDATLYTDSVYSKEYTQKIEKLFTRKIKTTTNRDDLTPWCMPLDTSKDVVSKKTALKANLKIFNYKDIKLVTNINELENDTYYILDGELSGRGHYLYPKDEIRIKKLLNEGVELIAEPKRDRFKDISTLFLGDNHFVVYENIIDNLCQYKGTIISDLSKEDWYQGYLEDIKKVHDYYRQLGIKYPFSIDSYFYRENSQDKIKVLSEVNARKTMGWMAYWLHRFFKSKSSLFFISRYEFSKPNLIQLNPKRRLFNTYFQANIKPSDIKEIREKL